jgi:small-conductance mechanosensitive channel
MTAFWHELQITTGIPGSFPWVVAGFLAAAGALHYFVPKERGKIRGALMLFGISVVGVLATTEMLCLGANPAGTMYHCADRVALVVGGIAMVNLGAVVLFAVILRPARLEPPPIAQDLLMALGYIAVGILILSHTGGDIRSIVATSAVLTAVIGFSLQDTLGNIMGGLALQMERTIRVGDWIRVEDVEGKVKQIRWRQTSVETRNWDTVVIPNSVLMKVRVTVLGRRQGAPLQRRQWVYFRVGLGHSPTKVIHVVESALHEDTIRHVAAEPKPHCLVTDFKDGDAVYAVRYWLSDLSQPDPTDSVIRTRIYGALRRAGIALATPTQSVLLTHEDETGRERRENEEYQQKLEALRKQEFFQALNDGERSELAPRLATAHWLYMIAEGNADVEVGVDGKTQRVATLRAGDIFGEMGLMTGELRTATVNALTDVTCYRLGKEAFVDILRSRPEIAEQISVVLARRRVELDAVREQLGQDAKGDRMRTMQGTLLRGIREFFGLS